MKQYLTTEQTAKLIELGFEKPKSISSIKVTGNIITTADDLIGEPSSVMGGKVTANYSIGELLSFLPQSMDFDDGAWSLSIEADPFKVNGTWWVFYEPSHHTESAELIDAIFAMVVKLKEEGMI